MTSTGNDIVALKAIDIQRTTLPAFYSKFITVAEQAFYPQPQFAAVPFQNFVWLLWSVKEAAYKYLKRSDSSLVFSPSKIIIQNISVPGIAITPNLADGVWESDQTNETYYTGTVVYETYQLCFRSKITSAFIASVVHSTAAFDHVFWGIKLIDSTDNESQSKQVRTFALKKLKAVLALDDLHIEKSPSGYPIFLHVNKLIDAPLSLAHHDNFVSYSFLLGQ
ncbi:MAG TPA: 4'-phosphopantetheinyl transferase superfamily protein [Mucilaginibacter sp.]